jgi:phosphoribosylformylglycinamidine cyclo-ligase
LSFLFIYNLIFWKGENGMNEENGKEGLTYAGAGVDIEKANNMIPAIKALAKKTLVPGAGMIGSFGGAFDLARSGIMMMNRPVLVSSTDGVGTKLKIAFAMDKHDTIGIDLVAMCANDVVVQGARLLYFLDYFATGLLKPEVALDVIKGISDGCLQANCALIGGETAEMPGLYQPGEYDLAGFAVGVVEREKMIDGTDIKAGHQLIGIASNGLHSNGYSLAHKVASLKKIQPDDLIPELDKTWGEELIKPTKIYVNTILRLISRFAISGIANITGGGIVDNVPRIIPQNLKAVIKKGSWYTLPIFPFIQQAGRVEEMEMLKTFNNGLGIIFAVYKKDVNGALSFLRDMGEKACWIGEVKKAGKSQKRIEFVD